MKKLLMGMASVLLISSSALAADLMPVKAPVLAGLAYPLYTGQGVYWGIGTEAGVEQTKASGNPLFVNSLASGNLMAAGGAVGGTVGYMKGGGAANWFAVEASANYNNITASGPLATGINQSFASRWNAEQVVKWGGFQQLLGMLPNLGVSFPSLPNIPTPAGFNIASNTAHPYVMAGIREWGIQDNIGPAGSHTVGIAPLVGMGVLNQLLDKNGKLSGWVLDTGAKVIFADKGKTLTFFDHGSPTVGGSVKSGTQYFAYLRILG